MRYVITEADAMGYGNPDSPISYKKQLETGELRDDVAQYAAELIRSGECMVDITETDDGCIDGRPAISLLYVTESGEFYEKPAYEGEGHERDEGAMFGGEVSGHYYFRDFYCADSGTIPALLILELLSVEGKKLSELLAPLRSTYFISGEINSEVADADAKIAEIEATYADATITHVDGVSVDYDDWHFNVRKSNTEPLLRLTLESLVSQQDMERRRDEVLGLIRS